MFSRFLVLFFALFFFPTEISFAKRVKAFIAADVTTGKILTKKNADKLCSPASLTKKMTLYLLFEALQEHRITLQTKFRVSNFASQQVPSKLYVKSGEEISVKTIIEALIIKSANDIAVVAAEGLCGSEKAFVAKMNQKAKLLGMHRTRFCNASGIFHPQQKTTARDMAILARAILLKFPEFVPLFQLRSFRYKGQNHFTHNHLLNLFHGTNGMKTGYIDDSGYNLTTSVVRFNKKGEKVHLLCIVLGEPSDKDRIKKTVEILEPLFLKKKALFYKTQPSLSFNKGKTVSKALSEPPHKPVLLYAPLHTKEGMKQLLKDWKKNQLLFEQKSSHPVPSAMRTQKKSLVSLSPGKRKDPSIQIFIEKHSNSNNKAKTKHS